MSNNKGSADLPRKGRGNAAKADEAQTGEVRALRS